ncbi:baculoviral IAP repeat-containing protein 7-B-like [Cloeon dipterum]|uniref:baculoviral IAP repeat-containing protein 7-B-like n=1 Tax=Cloeon dipterum TaxID=197152 RepID=UPI0032206A88
MDPFWETRRHHRLNQKIPVTAESSRTPPTNAPPAHPIIDENPHAPNFNLNLAMHRYFTFPLEFCLAYLPEIPHMLAELGFYYLIDGGRALLRCHFCQLTVSAEQFQDYFGKGIDHARKIILGKKLNCSIAFDDSKNVPMGEDVDSVLNYKFEAHRLYSLMKKTDWMFVEPFGLAKSGFYYTGDGDNVRCAFCNLEVRGWEEGDTPDGEHRRWNQNCPFLQNEKSVTNIPIGREQTEVKHDGLPKVNIGPNPFAVPDGLKKYGTNVRFVRQSDAFLVTSHALNIHDWSAPLNPEFATLSSRIDSYKHYWPKSNEKIPLEMALAGFFYTGTSDQAICFHCDLGLKDWMPDDDPFVQHCQKGANCQYLQMCKGLKIVLRTMHSIQDMEISNSDPPREQGIGNGDMRCLKCRNEAVSKVSLPCGHMTLCRNCTDLYCSVCKENIICEIIVQS